ncbi:hypothetical protein ACJD0Z_06820 [Flavobacteriaceae bacterium M23B6Z8]
MTSFRIFEHKKGIYFYPEYFIMLGLILSIFILGYLETFHDIRLRLLISVLAVFSLLFVISMAIWNQFRYQKLYGDFKGELIFSKTSIIINERSFLLEEIGKLEFLRFEDYYGNYLYGTSRFAPMRSNGTENELLIYLKNGEKIRCSFQQSESQALKKARAVLTHYHLNGLISWLHLLDLLQIEDYDEIQHFKRSIHQL